MVGDSILYRVRVLLREVLGIEPPSDNTDLMESGLMDSLALVTMIAELEQEFQVDFPLDNLDVDRFRSVRRIAEFLGETTPAVT